MNYSVAFIQAFIAAALCGNLACAQPGGGFNRPADQPAPRADRNSQIAHEQLIEKARKGGIDVYFLGDSITRRWGATDYPEFLANWNSNFFGWNAANFGWGADQIENMLWRLENGELDGVHPKIIVVLAGINNVGTVPGGDAKVDNITRGLKALVNVCQQKAPSAVIVLTALFPRNDNMAVIPTINKLNDNLARMMDGKKIRFLNVNDKLADKDGKLFEGISKDRLHPTVRGYQVWADGLKPIFTEILGPRGKTDHAPPPTGDPSATPSRGIVEQWGIYEVTLKGPTNGNPFTEVKFSARFTQGASVVEATGFYDGDDTYRVRFSPEKIGAWNYETLSSAPELNGKTGEFTVTAPSVKNHGPVRVTNTFHFAYADGTPYKELGTTCYVWEWQPEALQEQTLKTLASAPFNKIRFCVFPKRYQWNTNEPILYPFVGSPVVTNWDFTRFNPKYFQHLERRVADLQKLGIEADVILFHPYDQGNWGFDRMPADADDRYLHYVVARLAAYRNVWWSLANEWDFMKHKSESDFVRFGEIVSHDDPYHRLLSIHNGFRFFNHTLPWITHASVQNGSAVEEPGRAELYRDPYAKPIVFDEVKYEGNIDSRWGQLTAEEMVFRFWNATIAGTYCGHGETYKSADQILWWSKGGVLKGQSPPRLAFLKQVLDGAPADGIEPIDKWQHAEYGGRAPDYYLVYLGKQTPTRWEFRIPKQGKRRLSDGMKFTAEVLDTWNMTVTAVPGSFTLAARPDDFFGDQGGRNIELPGKPYIAIRIRSGSPTDR